MVDHVEVAAPGGHNSSSVRVLQMAQQALTSPSLCAPSRQNTATSSQTGNSVLAPTLEDDRCAGCERARQGTHTPVIRPVTSSGRRLHNKKDTNLNHPQSTHQQHHQPPHNHNQHHIKPGSHDPSHLRPSSMPGRVTGTVSNLSQTFTDSTSEFRHSQGGRQSDVVIKGKRLSSVASSDAQVAIKPSTFPDLRPPDPESWQRAAAYRMNNTNMSRSSSTKVIVRNRKQKPSVSISDSPQALPSLDS